MARKQAQDDWLWRILVDINPSATEWRIAQFVAMHPWLTLQQLHIWLGLAESTLTKYLRRLVDADLVREWDSNAFKTTLGEGRVFAAGRYGLELLGLYATHTDETYQAYLGLEGKRLADRKKSWDHTFAIARLVTEARRAGQALRSFGHPFAVNLEWEPDFMCRRNIELRPGHLWFFDPDSVLHMEVSQSRVCTWALEYSRTQYPGAIGRQLVKYARFVEVCPDIDGILVVLGGGQDPADIAERYYQGVHALDNPPPLLVAREDQIDRGAFFNATWLSALTRTDTLYGPLMFLRPATEAERDHERDIWRTDAKPPILGTFVGNSGHEIDPTRIRPALRRWVDDRQRWVAERSAGLADDVAVETEDSIKADAELALPATPAPGMSDVTEQEGGLGTDRILPDWLMGIVRHVQDRWWTERIQFEALHGRMELHDSSDPVPSSELARQALDAVDVRLAFAVATAAYSRHGPCWWEALPPAAQRPGWLVHPVTLGALGVKRPEELQRRWGSAIALQASMGGPAWPEWLPGPPDIEPRAPGDPCDPELIPCPGCGNAWCGTCQGYGVLETLSGEPLLTMDGALGQICPACRMRPCRTCSGSGIVARTDGLMLALWPRGRVWDRRRRLHHAAPIPACGTQSSIVRDLIGAARGLLSLSRGGR